MNDQAVPEHRSIETMLAQLDPACRTLMQDKFGSRLSWKAPDITKTIGPYNPDVFKKFQRRLVSLVESGIAKITVIPDEAIAAMVSNETEEAKAMLRSLFREELDALHSLFQRELPWYAAGFGHPDHIADFDYWAKMTRFSLLEITSLSIGIPPRDFPDEKILALEQKKSVELWPALTFFMERQEQLAREFGHRYQGKDIFPSHFLAWAEKMEFEVHPDFWRLLKKHHGGPQAEADAVVEQPLRKPDKREINTIAQLFTLIAIEELGYRPDAARSPIPKEIADTAANHGISVSEDTVRKYLRLGARLIQERSTCT